MAWNVDGRKKDWPDTGLITRYHETVESLRLWRSLAEALLDRDKFDRERRALSAKIEHDRNAMALVPQKDRVLADQRRKLRNAGEQVKQLKDFKCALCKLLREHGLGDLIPAAPPTPDPMRPLEAPEDGKE